MTKNSKLTNKKIEALEPRLKRYTVSDGLGLSLRVHPSGLKSWVLRTSFNGRVADTFLGHFPEISLHQARQASRRKRKELGQEPPKGYTLNDAFKLWCNLKRNRISSYKDEKRRLERHIISKIGSRQIDEITAPLVIYTVAPIEKAGHQATLKRVLLRTREILDLAVCAGYIPHNPINRVSKVFAPPKVTSMASIPWQELPELFSVAKAAPIRIQVLLFWSCLSLLRPHEAVKIRSDWIDGQTLIIPSTEMKRKREHRVPLNDISLSPHSSWPDLCRHIPNPHLFGLDEQKALTRANKLWPSFFTPLA